MLDRQSLRWLISRFDFELAGLGAWLVSLFLVAISAGWIGTSWNSAAAYAHWDSGLYDQIAREGYEFFSCSSYDPNAWCGNAGWFPGYPLAIRLLGELQIPASLAGVVISWCAGALLFAVLVALLRCAGAGLSQAWPCLLLAAVFPGGIYYFAYFPVSLFLLFSGLCVLFFAQGRWLNSSLLAAWQDLLTPRDLC